MTVKRWPGTWIAGVTNVDVDRNVNRLFYLMKVGYAFESQADLWKWLDKRAKTTKKAKAADRWRLLRLE